MIREGKSWHIDDDGILFIGKDFQRGKGFLPWFNDADSVTALVSIGERAFMGCESLRRLSLPSTLTEIGDLGLGCNSERLLRIDVAPRSGDRLLRFYGGLLFQLLQAFPVVDLLGFMDGLPEGDRPAVLGNFFEPGRPAIGEHEVCFSDP